MDQLQVSSNIILHKYCNDDFIGEGVDYNSGPYNVRFDVRVTRVSLTISINDDDILEYSETFNLNVNESSLPNSVTVGDHSKTTVTILDDDGKYRMLKTPRSTKFQWVYN